MLSQSRPRSRELGPLGKHLRRGFPNWNPRTYRVALGNSGGMGRVSSNLSGDVPLQETVNSLRCFGVSSSHRLVVLTSGSEDILWQHANSRTVMSG